MQAGKAGLSVKCELQIDLFNHWRQWKHLLPCHLAVAGDKNLPKKFEATISTNMNLQPKFIITR